MVVTDLRTMWACALTKPKSDSQPDDAEPFVIQLLGEDWTEEINQLTVLGIWMRSKRRPRAS